MTSRNRWRSVPLGLAVMGMVIALAQAARAEGGINGTITYKGPPAKAQAVKPDVDPQACASSIADESLQVDAGGGLANVVVEVLGAGKAKPAEGVLNQSKCVFIPHVQALPVGSKVIIQSSDSVLHNAHAYDEKGKTLFNVAAPPVAGLKIPQVLKKPGRVKIKCDAGHHWMEAWIYVGESSHMAVTGADGKFQLKGVPAGTHKVRLWHEKLGSQEVDVTVTDGGTATLNQALGG